MSTWSIRGSRWATAADPTVDHSYRQPLLKVRFPGLAGSSGKRRRDTAAFGEFDVDAVKMMLAPGHIRFGNAGLVSEYRKD